MSDLGKLPVQKTKLILVLLSRTGNCKELLQSAENLEV